MNADAPRPAIEHAIAELRAAFPRIAEVRPALEGADRAWSLRLDIRWPQHQTLLCGPLKGDPQEAVRAAFDAARAHLSGSAA